MIISHGLFLPLSNRIDLNEKSDNICYYTFRFIYPIGILFNHIVYYIYSTTIADNSLIFFALETDDSRSTAVCRRIE